MRLLFNLSLLILLFSFAFSLKPIFHVCPDEILVYDSSCFNYIALEKLEITNVNGGEQFIVNIPSKFNEDVYLSGSLTVTNDIFLGGNIKDLTSFKIISGERGWLGLAPFFYSNIIGFKKPYKVEIYNKTTGTWEDITTKYPWEYLTDLKATEVSIPVNANEEILIRLYYGIGSYSFPSILVLNARWINNLTYIKVEASTTSDFSSDVIVLYESHPYIGCWDTVIIYRFSRKAHDENHLRITIGAKRYSSGFIKFREIMVLGTADIYRVAEGWLPIGWNANRYIGIGTNNPALPLHVVGSGNLIRLEDTSKGYVGIQSNREIRFYTPTNAAQVARFKGIQVSTTYSGNIPDNGILFGTDTALYRLTSRVLKLDGSLVIVDKLGVGTETPAEKVDVIGNIRASKFIDIDDNSFYLDPNQLSILNSIELSGYLKSGIFRINYNGELYWTNASDYAKIYLKTLGTDQAYLYIEWGDNGVDRIIFYHKDYRLGYKTVAYFDRSNFFLNASFYLWPWRIYTDSNYVYFKDPTKDIAFQIGKNEILTENIYPQANNVFSIGLSTRIYKQAYINYTYTSKLLDLDDTSYYLDPNNISNLYSIKFTKLGKGGRLPYAIWTTDYGTIIRSEYSGQDTFELYRETSNFIGWYVRTKGRWIIKYYPTYVWVNSLLQVSGDVEAKKFVDLDNVSYYLDPNSLSILNETFINKIILGDYNLNLTKGFGQNGYPGLLIKTPNGWIEIGPQNAYWAHILTDRPRFYFNKPIVVDTGIIGSYNEDLLLAAPYNQIRVVIKSDTGNVGIGTTSPQAKLDVNGNVRIAALNDALVLKPNTMGKGDVIRLKFQDPDGGTPPVWFEYLDDGSPGLGFMNGNFGVGTNDPKYKLDVAGTMRVDTGSGRVKVENNGDIIIEI